MSISKTIDSGSTKKHMSAFQHIKFEHLIAGVSGGVISALVLHPLDLLKIRFAVHEGAKDHIRPNYNGMRNAFKLILRDEGVRGLFKGVTPNCWGSGASWGLYFFFYGAIKAEMHQGDLNTPLPPSKHLIAASEAGAMTLCFTNPLWVVKTRLCLQYSQPLTPTSQVYNGMMDALIKTYKYEGIKGLYRGFLPGLFGVSHGAIQFMVYEDFKKRYTKYYGMKLSDKLGILEYITFAASSKLVAAAVTYPYQVVRTRLQDQHGNHKGVIDVIKKIIKNESIPGFYKGLLPSLIRVVPATAITLAVYENISHFLINNKTLTW